MQLDRTTETIKEINEHPEIIPEGMMIALLENMMAEYDAMVEATRAGITNTLGEKCILVFDAGLGVPNGRIADIISAMKAKGDHVLADTILKIFFGGRTPQNSTDILQGYFGPNVPLVHRAIHSNDLGISTGREVGTVFYTGSPANISDRHQGQLIHAPVQGLTHKGVYDRLSTADHQRVSERLLALGICYGHQFVAERAGHKVNKMPKKRRGPQQVVSTTSRPAIDKVFDRQLPKRLFVSHGDAVRPHGPGNLVFLVADDNPNVSHGLVAGPNLNLQDGDDTFTKRAAIAQQFADGEPITVGLQAHPEQTLYFLALELIRACKEKTAIDAARVADKVASTRASLELFGASLAAHKALQN